MNDVQSFGLKIGKKTFISTIAVLVCVMVFSFILTQVVPMGSYERAMEEGREVIVPGSYVAEEGARLPVWHLFAAPVEVFLGPDAVTGIMIIVFIMLIGGVFLILEKCGLLKYALNIVIRRFAKNKYTLLAIVTLFGMALGSGLGLFEETIILAPITVALAISLGWDALVGIGMSVLAVGFGFSASTFNPFTTGVSQQLAGLPLFSGLWLRALVFAAVYALLLAFLTGYAKRIEQNPERSLLRGLAPAGADAGGDGIDRNSAAVDDAGIDRSGVGAGDGNGGDSERSEVDATADPKKAKKALAFFGAGLILIVAYIAVGVFIPTLTSYTMPVMALLITIGGLGAGFISGAPGVLRNFGKGMVTFLPAVVLIALAMSTKQIIVSGGIMDTLMQYAYNTVVQANPLSSLLLIYLFVLAFNFFIPGAAAKAFLLIPLLSPLAELIGLTRQSIVLAFTFGDGFSNMVFPTNPVLLITLGIVGVPYTTWFRWTWKLQAVLIAVCAFFLFVAFTAGYGPF